MTFPDSAPNSSFPTQEIGHDALFKRLQPGHTLVTGNSRLSRVLAAQYSQWRISLGDRQWRSPAILSWNLWLAKLWETASLQGVDGTGHAVPGNRQLINLWENTLNGHPLSRVLLRPESLANQLSDTRRVITDWQLNLNDAAWFGDENENHQAFQQWNKAFEQRCKRDNWLPPEDRTALLCNALSTSQLELSGPIDLLGFDEFNPAQTKLLEALAGSGCVLSNLSLTPHQSSATLWKSKDSKDELQQMARWVRYWYEKEPDCSIAVVVPDLQMRRDAIERQLQEVLTPAHQNNVQNDGQNDGQAAKPWNISMGTPLARLPMIETAFDLLKLLHDRIDIQDIGRVLRSPWLKGADTERNSRALLEKCLRERYPRQLKLTDVHYRAGEIKKHNRYHQQLPEDEHTPQPWYSPELTTTLNKIMRFKHENKGKRAASAWAESLDQFLASLGWPQLDAAANEPAPEAHNVNWQALQSWRESLRELASLDATAGQLGRATAISQLQKICREKVFQAHAPAASIQVLGLYEVSGLRFDHLWVVGLHNGNWPPSAKPNPFIPSGLQRQANLPNSSPRRELEVARIITQRLLETAKGCVFSYPGQIDGEDVLPSPLLSDIPPVEVIDLKAWQGHSWRNTVANAEHAQLDVLAMPGKLTHGTARGGSSILKYQALCPFRAFASNRLGAEGLQTPADGINAALHGQLVHEVLEHFWRETKTQANLLGLDASSLEERVRRHVDTVVNNEKSLERRPFFRDVEADRIYRLVVKYLQLEAQREAFEVVGFEKEILPVIEGQTIRLVIDRLDRIISGDGQGGGDDDGDGEEIIIDYKTGKVNPKKWFGDRPDDPQLPLYAISADKTPAAVAFAVIRDEVCEYKGVATRAELLPGLPPKAGKLNQYLIDAGDDMPQTIDQWRQTLNGLMRKFLAGEAEIDPKAGLKTCGDSYCELQSLCRVGELMEFQKAGRGIDGVDVSETGVSE